MNWLHEIFSEQGLIIIDGDNKELKDLFKPIIELELKEGFSNHSISRNKRKIKKIKAKNTSPFSRDQSVLSN